jgi:uncharacterized protein YhbP (UPF0306 family)
MHNIDNRITDFIEEHHVLTIAVSNHHVPWVASCFYVYMKEQNLFVFTSDHDTRHIKDFQTTPGGEVAGTIALETKITGKIRGIQFSGIMKELAGQQEKEAKRAYLDKFPIARLSKLTLWSIEPYFIKMTDNRLGFGKKLLWRS